MTPETQISESLDAEFLWNGLEIEFYVFIFNVFQNMSEIG